MQRDHAGPAVAKDARNGASRSEAEEAVRLLQPEVAARSGRAEHMPRFRALPGPFPAALRARDDAVTCRMSPAHFTESLYLGSSNPGVWRAQASVAPATRSFRTPTRPGLEGDGPAVVPNHRIATRYLLPAVQRRRKRASRTSPLQAPPAQPSR